jgi:putative flippase GtrA
MPMTRAERARPITLQWPASGSSRALPVVVVPAGLLRLARWGLAGGGSLVLQLAIQGVLVQTLGLPPKLGIVVGYELALVAHFFVNDRWVFEQQGRRAGTHRQVERGVQRQPDGEMRRQQSGGPAAQGQWRRLVEFHTSALVAEAVTLAVAFLLLTGPVAALLGPALAPFAATIAGTLAATAVTFSASFFWIWRPQRTR